MNTIIIMIMIIDIIIVKIMITNMIIIKIMMMTNMIIIMKMITLTMTDMIIKIIKTIRPCCFLFWSNQTPLQWVALLTITLDDDDYGDDDNDDDDDDDDDDDKHYFNLSIVIETLETVRPSVLL